MFVHIRIDKFLLIPVLTRLLLYKCIMCFYFMSKIWFKNYVDKVEMRLKQTRELIKFTYHYNQQWW